MVFQWSIGGLLFYSQLLAGWVNPSLLMVPLQQYLSAISQGFLLILTLSNHWLSKSWHTKEHRPPSSKARYVAKTNPQKGVQRRMILRRIQGSSMMHTMENKNLIRKTRILSIRTWVRVKLRSTMRLTHLLTRIRKTRILSTRTWARMKLKRQMRLIQLLTRIRIPVMRNFQIPPNPLKGFSDGRNDLHHTPGFFQGQRSEAANQEHHSDEALANVDQEQQSPILFGTVNPGLQHADSRSKSGKPASTEKPIFPQASVFRRLWTFLRRQLRICNNSISFGLLRKRTQILNLSVWSSKVEHWNLNSKR